MAATMLALVVVLQGFVDGLDAFALSQPAIAPALRSASCVKPHRVVAGQRPCGREGPTLHGIKMQADLQWHQYSGYNLGRWKGRALHLDPETGDYVQPYIIRDYVLDVVEEEGQAQAKERFIGEASKTLEPVVEETTIVANDDLDASGDGYYSADRCMASHPDVSGISSFAVTMSIPLTDYERVRCDVLYDLESKLQRIVLFQERRIAFPDGEVQEKAAFEGGGLGPLSLQDFIGSFTGDAQSRRSWRLGGGTLKYRSKGSSLWDGDKSVRREMEVADSTNSSRSVSWGAVEDAYSLKVDFESSVLFFLPGGCWVTAPPVLVDAEGAPVAPLSVLDTLRQSSQVEAAQRTLDLALGVESDADDLRGGGKPMQPFLVEFGIQLAEKPGQKQTRFRTQRVYGRDGRFGSAVSVEETRTA